MTAASQGFAEDGFGGGRAIVGGGVNEVDAVVNRDMHGADAVGLIDGTKGRAEGRAAEGQGGNLQAGVAKGPILHGAKRGVLRARGGGGNLFIRRKSSLACHT